LITTPLPTNSPAPMTPPRAIIVMCLCLRLWRSPLSIGGVLFKTAIVPATIPDGIRGGATMQT